jgi:hypothetical protein
MCWSIVVKATPTAVSPFSAVYNIIIIFIQLQLGWNPVAEVYNTYTATV